MLHVTFDSFDEIRNQVIATRQLYIDLGEGIPDAISEIDESVVNTHCVQDYRDNYREENEE